MRTAIATGEPEPLGEWVACGFSAAAARDWIADGATLDEAKAWRAIGLAEAAQALRWRVRRVTPGEARLLFSVGARSRHADKPARFAASP